MKTRAQIVTNARKLRAEIEQIFTDCASWNENATARKEGAEPIDCDPDGQLRRIADGIDAMLANESKHDGSFSHGQRVFHVLPKGNGRKAMTFFAATVLNVTSKRVVVRHDGSRTHRVLLPLNLVHALPTGAVQQNGCWILAT